MPKNLTHWIIFNVVVIGLLLLDLYVFNKKSHSIRLKEALLWTGFWVLLAVVFNFVIYWWRGEARALEFTAAYLVEESLSMDNLFVFLMLFTYFRTPTAFQHKVLFWGIFGAIIFRALFVVLGVTVINSKNRLGPFSVHDVTTTILGVFLLVTAIRTFFSKDRRINPNQNPIIRLFGKFMPVTPFYDEDKFFTVQNGKNFATPLFISLLVVETTDIVFAVDSVPAVLAISDSFFIIYTSNVLAILGLRALYFALAGIMELFHFLHYGLSFILLFIGGKIIASIFHINVSIELSLIVIGSILFLSILLSLIFRQKENLPLHHNANDKISPQKSLH
jgi:tellurite resistance protein TerC